MQIDFAHNMIQGQSIRMFLTGLCDNKIRHDVFAHPETLDAAILMAGTAVHTQALSGTPGRRGGKTRGSHGDRTLTSTSPSMNRECPG